MFRPMAQVVLLALGAALLLAFTLVPALVALLLRGRVSEVESPLVRLAQRAYAPTVRWALRRRGRVALGALALVALSGLLATRLGSEFVPTLDEGDLTIQALRPPGTSLGQAVAMQEAVERELRGVPRGRARVRARSAPPRSRAIRCRRASRTCS